MKKTKLTPRRAADQSLYLPCFDRHVGDFSVPMPVADLASLSKTGSLYDFKGFFPQEYSFQTFIDLFTDDVNRLYPYKTWFFNTLYVAACSALFGTVPCSANWLCYVPVPLSGQKHHQKDHLGAGHVPWIYGYDGNLHHHDPAGAYQ